MASKLSMFSNEISKFEFSKSKYSALPIVFESGPSSGGRVNQSLDPRGTNAFSSQKCLHQAPTFMTNSLDTTIEEEEDEESGPLSTVPLAVTKGPRTEWTYSQEDEDPRSCSPSGSTKSGHSSPSEIGGDSGVGSEHDTPPLSSRKPLCSLRRNLSTVTDSDDDSNISSESLPEIKELHLKKNCEPLPNHHRHKRTTKNHKYDSKIPDTLLRELKEKYKEFKRRRQLLRGSAEPVGGERPSLSRTNSYQRSGKLSRIHSHITTASLSTLHQGISTLSLADSSNFSSTTSLYTEEEEPTFLSDYRKPLYECKDEAASQGFAGISDIFAPQQESTIRSSKGTIRGVKNRVRAGIATFTSDQRFLKLYAEREKGKVVVYTTTLGTVRETYERCLRMRKILWTLLVHFEERDVFMSRDTQIQLLDRLHARSVSVPHVFLEGQYLGGVEFLERLNETGELRRLLQPYMRPASTTPCDTCGGYRLLPCTVCRGSKKSVHRNDFTLEFVALKCSACDESGLVGCYDCNPSTA